jgi:superfamily II DNA or RNA helicase
MLRDYQEKIVTNLALMLKAGKKKLVAQLPTGAGKTVVFTTITKRFIDKSNLPVIILVHRQELLKQTFETLYRLHNIIAIEITAETKKVGYSTVYIGMVETVFRRLTKNPKFLPPIGMLITDEVHISSFHKLYDFFPNSFIIGFTATPLSAKKAIRLKTTLKILFAA